MKITIEIPDNCYGDCLDEEDNLIINPPPVGDREKGRSYWTSRLTNGNLLDLRWLVSS